MSVVAAAGVVCDGVDREDGGIAACGAEFVGGADCGGAGWVCGEVCAGCAMPMEGIASRRAANKGKDRFMDKLLFIMKPGNEWSRLISARWWRRFILNVR